MSQRGLVAAWFGGTAEGGRDVSIWLSRREAQVWSPPVAVAQGVGHDGAPQPCWNPVLFQPDLERLLLFLKVGPNPRSWWGLVMMSLDGGESWSPPVRLPEGILGPIKNKPIRLLDRDILSPSSEERHGWRVHLERSSDLGETWSRTAPVEGSGSIPAIQPSILSYEDGRLQLVCRSKQRRVAESWSSDGGHTWSELRLLRVPNPNSGMDAVTLADGRQLLVYNDSAWNRWPLSVALSQDGAHWDRRLVLEAWPGEYSYPAAIIAGDGLVHITYTWNLCRIKHVVLDPARI